MFVQEAVLRFPVESYLQDHLSEATVSGSEVNANCPRCGDRKRHFFFNTRTVGEKPRTGVCFRGRCGWKPNLVMLVGELEHVDEEGAIRFIIRKVGPQPSGSDRKFLQQVESELDSQPVRGRDGQPEFVMPDAYLPITMPLDSLVQPGWHYLYRRGVSNNAIQRNRIGYIPAGEYAGSVVFPFVTSGGRIIGAQVRDITGQGRVPKQSIPGSRSWLFQYHLAVQYHPRTVVLVEGPIDALHATPPHDGELGDVVALAVMGSNEVISDRQRKLLRKLDPHQIVIMFDEDAWSRGVEIAKKLSRQHRRVSTVHFPYLDPGEFPWRTLRRIIKRAAREVHSVDGLASQVAAVLSRSEHL